MGKRKKNLKIKKNKNQSEVLKLTFKIKVLELREEGNIL
jgi:hypothetical protein